MRFRSTDEEGNTKMGDASKLLNDVIDNGIWDKMCEDEKKDLIDVLSADADTFVKLIDEYLKSMDLNEKLYNRVCELSDKEIKTHETVSNFVPQCKWAFDLLFRDTLHMDEFLKAL